MPELPEVEVVCRSLKRQVAGKTIRSVDVQRARAVFPLATRQFRQRLRGAQIEALRRRAKYLVFHLVTESKHPEQQQVLLIHLRMTGDMRRDRSSGELAKTVSIVFHLNDGSRLVLDDPRGLAVCQLLGTAEAEENLAALGIEPLSARFTAARLFTLTHGSRAAIKVLLMDQSRVAGLGNIYAAEALFRAGIHPKTQADHLTSSQVRRLRGAIVRVLRDAVQSALRGYQRPGGFGAEETFKPQVYGREGLPCRRCGSAIRRIVLGSRSTYYCPECQVHRDRLRR